MEKDGITLYCICRAPDIDRFMIMCDQCEEWYHGDCINITERESRRIKYFYCKWCQHKDSSLKVQYRKSKKHGKREKLSKQKIGSYEQKTMKHDHEAKKLILNDEKHNSEITTQRSDATNTLLKKRTNEETGTYQRYDMPHANAIPPQSFTEQRQKWDKGENFIKSNDSMMCQDRPPNVSSDGHQCYTNAMVRQCNGTDEGIIRKRKKKGLSKSERDLPHSSSQKDSKQPIKKELRDGQCYGPNCTQSARSKSKYCSDDCGKRLAAKRLFNIMPARVNQWNRTPTIANEIGCQELERIRSAMLQARTELQALEDKFNRLESNIARSKNFAIRECFSDAEDTDESDHCVFCVVCGHSVSLRSAIKHMDRCYIKIESQISFGSVYPTRIEGSERLFCDVYNRQQQTYCKRLQVICPEHSKEPKISANEVCGCPLTNDIFQMNEPTSENDFCGKAKRKCTKHYKWESMYRASVDLQRIRQWLKIDEIFEEERRIRNSMVSRAGVIPLLLHQTTTHDPLCLDMRTKPSNIKRPAYRLVI